ncbi:MAG: toprim domain-containing protein [Actinomyces sp.]|nr:MAG: toprim domain-containing protein [Actinomyces sp.]
MYDRDALLAATDLRSLADDLLGPGHGRGRSRMWPCPNPNHAQTGRTPPVSIFTSRRGEQRWRCHGCGDGGTAIDLVLACHGSTIRDAMAYLAARAGHHERPCQPPVSKPIRRPAPTREAAGCYDLDGLNRYVDECAERLWHPEATRLRHWLTHTRGLPAEVLARNRIGADLGPRRQPRPDGMPRASGVVLPVITARRATYAQIRIPNPRPDWSRYLNPSGKLAANPRLARIRPPAVQHPEIIITEGMIDALTAATAGYRTVALLSAAYADEAAAVALAKLPHPLVIALDPDQAGQAAAQQLAALLETRGRQPVVLHLSAGDLNDMMRTSRNWHGTLDRHLNEARASPDRGGSTCAFP